MDGRNPFRTTLKPWLKPLFAGIYRGNISPVCLRWCRILSIHSMDMGGWSKILPSYWTSVPKNKVPLKRGYHRGALKLSPPRRKVGCLALYAKRIPLDWQSSQRNSPLVDHNFHHPRKQTTGGFCPSSHPVECLSFG